ncbi:MAG: glutamine synthetase type III, partial [Synechococcaceae cyanobacterium]|nr:glutamine synthetase type III [Synechococcaceae cyanobacterium]
LGVDTLPDLNKDPGDRNRTSPFAFTGNRFEFRAVGSGQSVAGPLVVLNTILADSLGWIAEQLEGRLSGGIPLEQAALAVLQEVMNQHSPVIFGGNGYSEEWHRMAVEERGLENLRTSADALPVLRRDNVRELFQRTGVLTSVELESRFEVYAEQYILAIDVEAKLAVQITRTQIIPAALRYLAEIGGALQLAGQACGEIGQQISGLLQSISSVSGRLQGAIDSAPHGTEAHLRYSAEVLVPLMTELRQAVDTLEALVDDGLWPLPTYQEMLFVR